MKKNICFYCGHELIQESDFMRDEIGIAEDNEQENAIISAFTCPNCGCYYEMYYPNEEEKKDYKLYTRE